MPFWFTHNRSDRTTAAIEDQAKAAWKQVKVAERAARVSIFSTVVNLLVIVSAFAVVSYANSFQEINNSKIDKVHRLRAIGEGMSLYQVFRAQEQNPDFSEVTCRTMTKVSAQSRDQQIRNLEPFELISKSQFIDDNIDTVTRDVYVGVMNLARVYRNAMQLQEDAKNFNGDKYLYAGACHHDYESLKTQEHFLIKYLYAAALIYEQPIRRPWGFLNGGEVKFQRDSLYLSIKQELNPNEQAEAEIFVKAVSI